MNDNTKPANLTLARALHLARAGFVVFPCRKGEKRPATPNGLLDATTDEAVIRGWFDNDLGRNLAVPCGPQPNGINLLAIDIDPDHGGEETWKELIDGHKVPDGPVHVTRSGGQHLFFDMPVGLHNTSGRLGQGVDTRGVGGYVVVPPSRVVDGVTGEIGQYTTSRDTALSVVPVPELPSWLLALLEDEDIEVAQQRHPSQVGTLFNLGDSVADLARVGWVWDIELDRDGWSLVRRSGGDSYWARPGKNPRDGHSAVVGDDGPLRVFTTECPGGGVVSTDGTVRSYSPWDYIVAYRAEGDTRRAAAIVRGQRTMQPGPAAPAGADEVGDIDDTPTWPIVPAEYWSATARNQHILQAAHNACVPPDALDVVMFAYQALVIPPCYVLPRIIGRPLNFLACLVGTSGMFKSKTVDIATELMGPLPYPKLMLTRVLGSGEGLSTLFLGEEREEDDKGKLVKTGRLTRNEVLGVLFKIDEGSALIAQAQRSGATIVPKLCSAWSGEDLGETNAEMMRNRHVAAGSYRLTAVLNIQPKNFDKLFSEVNTGTGLTGRFMFAGTGDPDTCPAEWPGELAFPRLPVITGRPVEIDFAPSILARIEAEARERLRTSGPSTVVDAIAQNRPSVARMAAIAMFAEDRRTVTEDDWELAEIRAAASASVLQTLGNQALVDRQSKRGTAANERAEFEMTVDERKEARYVARMAEAMWRHVKTAGAGGIGRNKLIRAVTSDATRHRGDAALDRLIGDGRGRLEEGRVYEV